MKSNAINLEELIGKTIKSAKIIGHDSKCDGENLLILTMTDVEKFFIEGGYGGYTGKSCDEYFEWVEVRKIKERYNEP